jgi:hypothetical protein
VATASAANTARPLRIRACDVVGSPPAREPIRTRTDQLRCRHHLPIMVWRSHCSTTAPTPKSTLGPKGGQGNSSRRPGDCDKAHKGSLIACRAPCSNNSPPGSITMATGEPTKIKE